MEGGNIVICRIPSITNMQACQNHNLMFYREIIALATHGFFIVFDFDFLPLQQAIEIVQLSWVFRENCLSVFCEFFRGMITVLFQWVPLFFRGAAVVAAFSGYSF